ncbi:MAG TPA: SDR family NAD(P)-dependent oxidoreductase, partial [Candidatus Lokiarchaeia archaeon]
IAQLINNKKIKALIIAIPSATKNQINSILDNCKDLKVKILLVPYLYEINNEKLLINQLREIKPEAILFRESITWDDKNLVQEITGKRILVTGAGGSIGSELCRQILKYNLKELLLFERSEYNLFRITNELKKAFPNSVLYPCIADLVDYEMTSKIIKKFQPDIIFHAAAYKHLFLMEINPESAIKNNIIGTVNLTRIAIDTHVNKLVLISTDKAVNPTCIMGATKRICEEYIRATAKLNGKIFFGVRFGNVLDSSGSVLQIFKEQISQGGPVTVTDINAYRYFMTIPEAAHLVLQTPSFATGGEIFILNMGKPVRIYDLAKKLVNMYDLEVASDIDIVFTGLKPGEKLNEELFEKNEKLEITPHEKILKIENNGNIINLNRLNKDIDQLVRYSNEMNQKAIFQKIEEMIPTFQASVTQNFNLAHIENDN